MPSRAGGRLRFFLSAFGIGEGFSLPAFPAVKFIWLPALPPLREGEVWVSTRTWKQSWGEDEGRILAFLVLLCPEWVFDAGALHSGL